MSAWYCEGCLPNKGSGLIACAECCGWRTAPSDAIEAHRFALDLVDAFWDAALDLDVIAFAYGAHDTNDNDVKHTAAREAIDVARTKLREHLTRMARGEQVAS